MQIRHDQEYANIRTTRLKNLLLYSKTQEKNDFKVNQLIDYDILKWVPLLLAAEGKCAGCVLPHTNHYTGVSSVGFVENGCIFLT